MTNLKDKLKNTWNWIKENPKKVLLGAGLIALTATTALKDNVHFGSVTLNNPQENHYVFGIHQKTEIQGKNSKGNIYTLGLVGINELRGNSQITGNMSAYGLMFAGNFLGYHSQITGNMSAYGSIIGENFLGYHSQITGNISNKGLFVKNDIAGFSLGSNDVKGLKNKVEGK